MNTLENLLSWKPIADKKRSIPAFVRERDFMAISAIFSDVDGNKIKKRRNELTTIITAESIKGEDFWYFLESLLIIDSLRYSGSCHFINNLRPFYKNEKSSSKNCTPLIFAPETAKRKIQRRYPLCTLF